MREVLQGVGSSFEPEEIISYGDFNLNQEARENYREKHKRDPTPEELERYIVSGEEFRDARKKELGVLVG
jgi:hypothetical protein